jgi:hypothetical protein
LVGSIISSYKLVSHVYYQSFWTVGRCRTNFGG